MQALYFPWQKPPHTGLSDNHSEVENWQNGQTRQPETGEKHGQNREQGSEDAARTQTAKAGRKDDMVRAGTMDMVES